MEHMATALILLLGLTGALAEGADRDSLAAKATAAFAAKNWQEAETIFKQLVAFEPTRWDFQQKLINAQIALEHYDEALASCDKAIAYGYKGVEGMAPPNAEKAKAALATLLTTRGNILLKQHRMADAIAAYEKAAAVSTNPGVAYFNICALLYNQGRMQEVVPVRQGDRGRPDQGRCLLHQGIGAVRRRQDREWQDGTAGWRHAGVAKISGAGTERFARDRRQGDADLGRPDHRDHLSEPEAKLIRLRRA
jgi:tetratricopeptide (TPR) repeat protein